MKKNVAIFNRSYQSIMSMVNTQEIDEESLEKAQSIQLSFRKLEGEYDCFTKESKQISKSIGIAKKSGLDVSHLIAEKKELIDSKINPLKKRIEQQLQLLSLLESSISHIQKINSVHQCLDNPDSYSTVKQEPNYPISYALANNSDEYILSDQFVESLEISTIYHLSHWKKVIESVFNNKAYLLLAWDCQKNICGILPFIRLKSRLFGDFCVSMPYFNYGGPIALNDEIEKGLIESAIVVVKELGVEHFELRGIKERTNINYPFRSNKVNMVLTLPDSDDLLKKGLKAKVRSQIKKAYQVEHEIRIGGVELIDDFYKVFSINMRDLGTPVYSKEFFKQILLSFKKESSLIILTVGGKAASAGFLIGYKQRLEIPWASTLKKFNRYNINMLMYWNILTFAIEKGYKEFDFGRSTIGCGTYKFKKQWGATAVPLYWYYWLRDSDKLPELSPDNLKFRILIAIWKRLPVFITKIVGPPLVAKLP